MCLSNRNKENSMFVEAHAVNMSRKSLFAPCKAYKELICPYYFSQIKLWVSMATDQIERLDNNDMFGRGLREQSL